MTGSVLSRMWLYLLLLEFSVNRVPAFTDVLSILDLREKAGGAGQLDWDHNDHLLPHHIHRKLGVRRNSGWQGDPDTFGLGSGGAFALLHGKSVTGIEALPYIKTKQWYFKFGSKTNLCGIAKFEALSDRS